MNTFTWPEVPRMTMTGCRARYVVRKSPGFGIWLSWHTYSHERSQMRSISSSKMTGSVKIDRSTRITPSAGRSSR